MIDHALAIAVRQLLKLRYRISVIGLDAVASRGRTGIVFLPNHPALIDPIIMMANLLPEFCPRVLADKDQVDRFLIRRLARHVGVRAIPEMGKYGLASRQQIEAMLAESIEGLRHGENLLLYPAGRVYRSYLEDLGGNSAVEMILQKLPDVRVVLVRTRGLWGSSFSYAGGRSPQVGKALMHGARSLLASGVFFAPKRQVTIEFVEPSDLPRSGGRSAINRYLESFYNDDAQPNTYVPYSIWERGGPRVVAEPSTRLAGGGAAAVPSSVRELVIDHLKEASGRESIKDQDRLAADLGLDSLARVELGVFIEKEFGFAPAGPDAMETVADVLMTACGQAAVSAAATTSIQPPVKKWFAAEVDSRRLELPQGQAITSVLLRQAKLGPSQPILFGVPGGTMTYRRFLAAVMAMKRKLATMPGENLGIMLPAGLAADIAYFAALFVGKIPVMVNWTQGQRNIVHSLDLLGVQRVITARALVSRLDQQGVDLSALGQRLSFIEDLRADATPVEKLRAFIASWTNWSSLEKARVADIAAVLFTSGSEALPKAVPLTHANILANLRDVTSVVALKRSDCLLGMLPPFHSFGLSVTMILPLCTGMRVCYFPNPNDGAALAAIAQACRCTLTVGTPSFLGGMARLAGAGQLDTLRLAVSGAEKCPPRVYEALEKINPGLKVLEGYGITECSPIVSVGSEDAPVRESIGKVLPSMDYLIVDPENLAPVEVGRSGMLLLRGPSVFGGYLNYEGPSPFVTVQGRQWYRTGDLVRQDADGVLYFAGRLKRFAKIGGEMISLPAIEAVLEQGDLQEGPTVAVEASGDIEHSELVLFTTTGLTREQVNAQIKAAGLSPLHNIRRVVYLDEIPLLGTGKIDYRQLRERL